jgi:hypothetical protein
MRTVERVIALVVCLAAGVQAGTCTQADTTALGAFFAATASQVLFSHSSASHVQPQSQSGESKIG